MQNYSSTVNQRHLKQNHELRACKKNIIRGRRYYEYSQNCFSRENNHLQYLREFAKKLKNFTQNELEKS